ncbi:hypothetical protein WMW72_10655 [Paenibacillus filicis]|uniref:DUF4083 domain-containing protein n=1 Tax=Paenibacillus filicis TaxID=669464 RepID=A0ABU9DHK7_9BACL
MIEFIDNLLQIVFVAACLSVMYWIIRRQQRTIDALNDRLMARDYREYKAMQTTIVEPQEQLRKPKSWYDDPTVEEVN